MTRSCPATPVVTIDKNEMSGEEVIMVIDEDDSSLLTRAYGGGAAPVTIVGQGTTPHAWALDSQHVQTALPCYSSFVIHVHTV